MQAFVAFVFGVLVGWFLARVRDQQAARPRLEEARLEAIRARQKLGQATADLPASPQPAGGEQPGEPEAEDDLTVIKGIGPVFQRRLRTAGIHTYTGLASADPEQLRQAVQAEDWQNIEPESWIEEARRLAPS